MSPRLNVEQPRHREFDHFILTRFNVRVGLGRLGTDPAWLDPRLMLFERYCLPTMRAQKCKDFTWLVFVDAETPAEQRERIESLLEPMAPVYVDGEFTAAAAQDAVVANRGTGRPFVITTRLDNDDAVSRWFVSDIQRRFARQTLAFVNPTYGYELSNGRLYWRADPANPFVSLIERCTEAPPKTVLVCQHEEVHLAGPVEQAKDRPEWLQLIHGQNIVNRRRGIRVPLRRLRTDFPLELEWRENRLACRVEQAATASHLVVRTVTNTRKLKKLLKATRG